MNQKQYLGYQPRNFKVVELNEKEVEEMYISADPRVGMTKRIAATACKDELDWGIHSLWIDNEMWHFCHRKHVQALVNIFKRSYSDAGDFLDSVAEKYA